MPACSSEQCRYRWTHCLDPEINRDPLTPDEYRAILEHQAKVGNKWSKLAKELSGRYVTRAAM
jgi:myb proto-oncogene protein